MCIRGSVGPYNFELFVTSELFFFMPAPTTVACKTAKVESNLVAGMFLDYYVGPFWQVYWSVRVCMFRGLCWKEPTSQKGSSGFRAENPPHESVTSTRRGKGFTVDGQESKDAGSDPIGLDVGASVPPPAFPDDRPSTEVMLDLNNPFSYEETHKVLKDGRTVGKDPVTVS